MTRRKKSKSKSGNGAVAVSAPVQAAPAAASLQDGTGVSGLPYVMPTSPRTGYSLLAPRPVYPVLAPRPVQSLTAPRLAHVPLGPRAMYTPPGPRVGHLVTAPHPVSTPRSGTAARSGTSNHPGTAVRLATAVHPGTVPRPVAAATRPQIPLVRRASQVNHKTTSGDLQDKLLTEHRPVSSSCDHSIVTTSTASSTRSEEASSVVSVASSNISDFKDKKKPKKPYKVKVTYETKEMNIYPRQPILMVERLQNLDFHVAELTEALGRRPGVYPQGRRVRFVPETASEAVTIQRYLARIEAQERIAWCSYTLPSGHSLKVTVKVKVVERIKIPDNLTKLSFQDEQNAVASEAIQVSDGKAATFKQSGKKDKRTTSGSVKKTNIKKQGNDATIKQISTSNTEQLHLKTEESKAAVKCELGVTGSVQSNKVTVIPNMINQSAIKLGRIHVTEPNNTTETEKTAAAVKSKHVPGNKLRIVGFVGQIK